MAVYHCDNILGNNANTGTSAGVGGAWADPRGAAANSVVYAIGDVLMLKATGTDYNMGTISTAENITSATVPIFITRETGDTLRPRIIWTKNSTSTPSLAASGAGTLAIYVDNVDFQWSHTTGSNINPAGCINGTAGGNVNLTNVKIDHQSSLSTTPSFTFSNGSAGSCVIYADNLEIDFHDLNVTMTHSQESLFVNCKLHSLNNPTATSSPGSLSMANYKRCMLQANFINAAADQTIMASASSDTAIVFENNNCHIKTSTHTSGQKSWFTPILNSSMVFMKDSVFSNGSGRTNINVFASGVNNYRYLMGNNCLHLTNFFGSTPTGTTYMYGANTTLTNAPFISTTVGNSNWLKIDPTTAESISSIVRKAYQNSNGDIGAEIFPITGSSGGSESWSRMMVKRTLGFNTEML